VGQPLSWDLYTVSGVLVATAGTVVESPDQLVRLRERSLFREVGENDDSDVAQRINSLIRHFPTTLRAAGSTRLEPLIRLVAQDIMNLAELDHDATLGMLRLMPVANTAIRHCLLTALLAQDMAKLSLPPKDPQIETTVCAALTMNIAAMDLHRMLDEYQGPLDSGVRDLIGRHPNAGAEILRRSRVRDKLWLETVTQHHEQMDGSGYPAGLKKDEISIPARILRIADFYVAKIRGRRYRRAVSARSAFRELFGTERSRLDNRLALMLLRRIGLFPPGTLVRLSSRETALITRKQGSDENVGKVIAFINPSARPHQQPIERNTNQPDFSVIGIVDPDPDWPAINWPAFWGY